MKKYLVKATYVATEKSDFAGQDAICWTGKRERVCGMVGSHPEALHTVMPLDMDMVREYGYKSKACAKRSYKCKQSGPDSPWTVTAEIVEVEV